MGCLVKIVFALTILMIVYGAFELSIWLRERAPVELTVRQYAAASDPPKWVVLKEGWVDWSEARESMDDWYVPVRAIGSNGPTKVVLEIRDPAHLKLARDRAAGDATMYTEPLRGLGGGELFLGSRGRRGIVRGGGVSDRFVVVRENATRSFWLPLMSLIGGCLLVRGGFWVMHAVRRPKPPATAYTGPPLPPEQLLAETRRLAGEPPRRIKRYGGLRIAKPSWLVQDESDALSMIYLEEEALLTSGRIVWGQIVQANSILFDPGQDDAPAAVIYSTDPWFDARPQELSDIAHELFLIKGEDTDPDLARFASILADEVTREMRLEVPRRLTGGREVIYTSVMVRRADLPDRRLADELFPLLVLPEQTPATLIAPWEWWSPALVARWRLMEFRSQPPPPPLPSAPPPLPPR